MVIAIQQITLDDFIEMEKELICCSLSAGFHWIRITDGGTPSPFSDRVDFKMNGFENLYVDTKTKDQLIYSFDGCVKSIHWEGIRQ